MYFNNCLQDSARFLPEAVNNFVSYKEIRVSTNGIECKWEIQ